MLLAVVVVVLSLLSSLLVVVVVVVLSLLSSLLVVVVVVESLAALCLQREPGMHTVLKCLATYRAYCLRHRASPHDVFSDEFVSKWLRPV